MAETKKFIAARLPVTLLEQLESARRSRSDRTGHRVSVRALLEEAVLDLIHREELRQIENSQHAA